MSGRWGDDFTGDDRTWGDVAAERNQTPLSKDYVDASTPNPYWRAPNGRTNNWQPPGHSRMFRDTRVEDLDDNPKRSFTTRKKHGWWGPEIHYDQNGREIGR